MSVPEIPAPPRWGVGRLTVGGHVVAWPLSQADVDDEAVSAGAHLDTMGVGAADRVLIVSLLSEIVHVVPFEMAINARGALFMSADATPGDAFRVAALTERLAPRAVLGVCEATLEGFAELGRSPADVLGQVPVVVTSDEPAHQALEEVGLAPRRWLRLGPASALECDQREGAHLDGARWAVTAGPDGRLAVSGRVPRLTPAERMISEVRGRVVDEPCACGRSGPRILHVPVG